MVCCLLEVLYLEWLVKFCLPTLCSLKFSHDSNEFVDSDLKVNKFNVITCNTVMYILDE